MKRRGVRRNSKIRGLLTKTADSVEEAIVHGSRGRRRKVERGTDWEGTKVQSSKQQGEDTGFIVKVLPRPAEVHLALRDQADQTCSN